MAILRRNKEDINLLIEKGAQINQVDNDERNYVHKEIINIVRPKNVKDINSGTFDFIQFIAEKGADINKKDIFGRAPFFYLFVGAS